MLPARLSQAWENCNIYLFTLTSRLEIIIHILQCKQSECAYWNLKLSMGFLRSARVIRNSFSLLVADDASKQSTVDFSVSRGKKISNVLPETLTGSLLYRRKSLFYAF